MSGLRPWTQWAEIAWAVENNWFRQLRVGYGKIGASGPLKSGNIPWGMQASPGDLSRILPDAAHPVAACRRQARSGACVVPIVDRFSLQPWQNCRREIPPYPVGADMIRPQSWACARTFQWLGAIHYTRADNIRPQILGPANALSMAWRNSFHAGG